MEFCHDRDNCTMLSHFDKKQKQMIKGKTFILMGTSFHLFCFVRHFLFLLVCVCGVLIFLSFCFTASMFFLPYAFMDNFRIFTTSTCEVKNGIFQVCLQGTGSLSHPVTELSICKIRPHLHTFFLNVTLYNLINGY